MTSYSALSTPIFIICRDKVTPLADLVGWLEIQGYQRIVLVDNASTYPALLDYLAMTSHYVVRMPTNLGPWAAIWDSGILEELAANEHYAVTDSDVVPDRACPGDALDVFKWALSRYPGYIKAGFGLRIDDLPDRFSLANDVRGWEQQRWSRRLSSNLFHASIDTTFALYRPGTTFSITPAIRTGFPYVARHIPWYSDTKNPTDEEQYYRDHCDPNISHWDVGGYATYPRVEMSLTDRARWRLHAALVVKRNRSAPRVYRPG